MKKLFAITVLFVLALCSIGHAAQDFVSWDTVKKSFSTVEKEVLEASVTGVLKIAVSPSLNTIIHDGKNYANRSNETSAAGNRVTMFYLAIDQHDGTKQNYLKFGAFASLGNGEYELTAVSNFLPEDDVAFQLKNADGSFTDIKSDGQTLCKAGNTYRYKVLTYVPQEPETPDPDPSTPENPDPETPNVEIPTGIKVADFETYGKFSFHRIQIGDKYTYSQVWEEFVPSQDIRPAADQNLRFYNAINQEEIKIDSDTVLKASNKYYILDLEATPHVKIYNAYYCAELQVPGTALKVTPVGDGEPAYAEGVKFAYAFTTPNYMYTLSEKGEGTLFDITYQAGEGASIYFLKEKMPTAPTINNGSEDGGSDGGGGGGCTTGAFSPIMLVGLVMMLAFGQRLRPHD